MSTMMGSVEATKPSIGASMITGVVAMFVAVSTLFTAARVYTRFRVHQQFWWDDWSMVVAWMATVALCALQVLMVHYGAGHNVSHLSPEELAHFSKIFTDLQPVARIAIFFAKLSILLFYIRVFYPRGVVRDTFWWIAQVVILINFLYTVALVLLIVLQCVPSGRPWGDSCVDQFSLLVVSSVINIISDVVAMVIPMVSVWKLHMNRKKKWALGALFAFGGLAPLASIGRLVYQIVTARGQNKTVIYAVVALLATAEQVVGIVVGCAPVISAWAVKRARRDGRGPRESRTAAQNIWLNRERAENGNCARKVPDAFSIPTYTGTGSQEILCSQAAEAEGDTISKSMSLEMRDMPH